MTDIFIDSIRKHRDFLASDRKHILMITNHGIHQWQIIPGLPDTGGQNVFVNAFTKALVERGFRVTIANRGGYPHPVTDELRQGIRYKDEYQRIVYLEDNIKEFVRKEDMPEHIPQLVESLKTFLGNQGDHVDMIISHYWDGANIGVKYNRELPKLVKHIWVPHSLGAIKKQNVDEDEWVELRIDERIEIEQSMIDEELDGIAATSSTIQESLESDYGYAGPELFLPSCIDTDRFHPRDIADDDEIWQFLSDHSELSPEQIQDRHIITEITRTDTTKRKDVLIKAFAKVHEQVPDSLLVVSIDDNNEKLAQTLKDLISECQLDDATAMVGYIWDMLPKVYAVTDVYCTPSVMEGFGMSAQEATATRVPIVASHLVPFVTQYLLGDNVKEVWYDKEKQKKPLRQGCGAIVVPADDVVGFAHALEMLLADDELRRKMGEEAYKVTIPYFSWSRVVDNFLDKIDVSAR
jgi:glycosyltransferase involved in cell wall biosynthesis